ncbi:MAG TPA: lipopolysaccharide biosynthesis protein [Casimicrobium huifangae]|nr:lipopolysaccharide biosynthesis protein [Casimicrobium huifangae]
MTPPITHRAAHATLWSALEITTRYGVLTLVTIVLARLLTPADFGLVAMILVFVSVGTVLADAGFGVALVQRQATDGDDEVTVLCFSVGVTLALSLALWLSASWVASFYHQPELQDLTRVLVWVLPLGALGTVPDALLTKRLDFKARAKAQLTASLVSGGVAVAMALRGMGVWSLVAQALCAAGLRSVMLWQFSRWRPKGHFSRVAFRRLFAFGGFMLLSGLLNTVSIRIQTLVIGRLFDAGTLGYYTLAQGASGVPASLMDAVLSRVGLPVFSELAHDKARLREALQRALNLGMFLFVPCMVGMAIVARPLIELVYGSRWIPAAPMLALLSLGCVLWPIHTLNLAALNAQGRSDRFFQLEIFKNIAVVAATLIAAHWGAVAVAGAMLIAGVCSAYINTRFTHSMLGYGLAAQLAEQWPTWLMTLLAALPAWAILHWTQPSALHTTASILCAIVIYVSLAAISHCKAWRELTTMIHHLARSQSKTGHQAT